MSIPLRVVLVGGDGIADEVISALGQGGYEVYSQTATSACEVESLLTSRAWDTVLVLESAGPGSTVHLHELIRRLAPDIPVIELPGMESDIARWRAGVVEAVRTAMVRAQDLWAEREAQAVLVESEARFHALFEHSAIGINLGDASGRCLTSNPAFQRMLGYTAEQLRGARFAELTAPEDLDRDMQRYHQLRAGEVDWYQTEKRYLRRDGSRLWARATISIVRDEQGRPLYDIALIEDISDQKRAEAALQAAETLTSEVVDNAQEGIVVVDRDLRCVLWNPYLQRLFDIGNDAAIGLPILDLFSTLGVSDVTEALQAAMAGAVPLSVERPYESTASGRNGWIGISFAPRRAPSGDVVGVIGIVTDITERRRAEDDVRNSLELLSQVMEGTADAIFVKDLEGRYLMINSAGARQLKARPEEIVGKTDSDFFDQESAAAIVAHDGDVIRDGVSRTAEHTSTIGGIPQTWLSTKGPVRDSEGTIVGLVGISRDITQRKVAEEALRASEARFQAQYKGIPLPTYTWQFVGDDWVLRDYNIAAAMATRGNISSTIGTSARHHYWAHPQILEDFQRCMENETTIRREITMPLLGTHEDRDVVVHFVFVAPDVVMVHVADITSRKRAEEALRRSEEQYRTVVEASLDGIATVDMTGRIVFANRQMASMLGASDPSQLIGRDQFDFMVPEERERGAQSYAETLSKGHLVDLQFTLTRLDGTIFPAELSVSVMTDDAGDATAVTAVVKDITERKAYEDRLKHQAMHDGLTGLPNRTLFGDRLGQSLRAARRTKQSLAVLLFDLDRFKEVNDTLGHAQGDVVLQHVSRRFRAALRESDTVARFGGDEFAVLLLDTDENGAVNTARKLLKSLEEPFELDNQIFYLGASIGIVVYPQHGGDVHTLVQRADVAMYVAKEESTGWAVYSAERDPHSHQRLGLASGLRRAIDHGQLLLHYQPKVHLDRSCADHVEALVRWQHPELGLVPPDQFIRVAEQTGLIKPLTVWVVDEAIRQVGEWLRNGLDIEVAINLSAWSLHDPDLVANIEDGLHRGRVQPQHLLVELTESALMRDPERALRTITDLHDLGVRVAVDDFGTGYSSLAYLQRLSFDEIKIDRSFVTKMEGSSDSSTIITRSVIDLGHNLGLQVVAEGVETNETFEILQSMGCDLAQGYYIGRPMLPAAFETWLRSWSGRSGASAV